MQNHHIILFDGVCNFCNFWVNFIMNRDKNDIYKFAAMQSESGQKLLQEYKLNVSDFDSFVLIVNDKHFTKSTAALKISKNLRSVVKLLYPLIILPGPIRDFFYDLIAKNRYKFFGKRDFCRIPTEEERDKFLN
ncbi:MAG: thiol-disulfide oxidoreductase DCC family protein [Bacteroidetes bacterium]|nr:thiol-disulfide oxidoreductase DCC family protein [Bacteroidota bacterium]